MEKLNDKGSVLIVSIWTLMILSVLALSFSHATRIGLKLAGYHTDELILVQAAKMTARWTATEIAKNGSAVLKDCIVPGAHISPTIEGSSGWEDESGRLNVNKASREELQKMFSSPEIAGALMDWLDEDNETGRDGAERSYYASRGLPYTSRNGPLADVEELLLLKGMTPELYQRIRQYVTVFGSGQVNLNSSTSRVLEALGLEPSLVYKIMSFRYGKDGRPNTGDDRVFSSAATAPALLSAETDLSADETASLTNVLQKGRLSVQPGHLRLSFVAHVEDGSASRMFELVIVPRNGHIAHWREIL